MFCARQNEASLMVSEKKTYGVNSQCMYENLLVQVHVRNGQIHAFSSIIEKRLAYFWLIMDPILHDD